MRARLILVCVLVFLIAVDASTSQSKAKQRLGHKLSSKSKSKQKTLSKDMPDFDIEDLPTFKSSNDGGEGSGEQMMSESNDMGEGGDSFEFGQQGLSEESFNEILKASGDDVEKFIEGVNQKFSPSFSSQDSMIYYNPNDPDKFDNEDEGQNSDDQQFTPSAQFQQEADASQQQQNPQFAMQGNPGEMPQAMQQQLGDDFKQDMMNQLSGAEGPQPSFAQSNGPSPDMGMMGGMGAGMGGGMPQGGFQEPRFQELNFDEAFNIGNYLPKDGGVSNPYKSGSDIFD